ncbi:P-loop containing nucleoside triphosphate hydrolase protein [Auricularia subglabra TFB-10046 SS5]|nr:P-loop containing nucleoside triphosphate hydrolase protein [Auricularia subglabra TFB-10046 SS5]
MPLPAEPRAFNVMDDEKVVHSRFAGVWDLYELYPKRRWSMPDAATWCRLRAAVLSLLGMHGALFRLLLDRPRTCLNYFLCEAMAEVVLPNTHLWFATRFLYLLDAALETQSINIRLVAAVLASKLVTYVLCISLQRRAYLSQLLLQQRVQNHFILHLVKAFALPIFEALIAVMGEDTLEKTKAWAATCSNESYTRFRGLRQVVVDGQHRQEIVVGNLGTHITSASRSVLDLAVHYLSSSLDSLVQNGKDIFKRFGEVKVLYDLADIRNEVEDGTMSFPENARETGQTGLRIEFRCVSFKYPGTDDLALRNVSFVVDSGFLAVIVGFNGSGKSTILKLISRIYDPSEGEILIDGRDIRSLRLHDLRETMAVMFQNYTLFPLSANNIAFGDPGNAWDDEAVNAATKAAGIDFEHKLPKGMDTYIYHPVQDRYSDLPEGTQSLFGRKISLETLKSGIPCRDVSLSGGETQKIAVARAIMRATSKDDRVGLVMFDEPSSALDPIVRSRRRNTVGDRVSFRRHIGLTATALFETLRGVRGGKTMLFSSHRYGNLTHYADIVFYMKDGEILERGTHEELIRLEGGYAEMWKKQADAFTA